MCLIHTIHTKENRYCERTSSILVARMYENKYITKFKRGAYRLNKSRKDLYRVRFFKNIFARVHIIM